MTHKLEQYLQDAEVPLEFEDEREEVLVRQAVLGEDVREWLSSPVGRWVAGCAAQDQREIEEQLTGVKPNTRWRRRRIEELQQKHAAITLAIGWLSEAVKLGSVATRELKQPDE